MHVLNYSTNQLTVIKDGMEVKLPKVTHK